jgi:hypothetical protein
MSLFGSKPSEVVCPGCGEREAFTPCCLLYRAEYNPKTIKLKASGARLSCQSCGMVFSVAGYKTFHHHPQALPWTPVPTPQMQVPQTIVQKGEKPRIVPMDDSRPTPIYPKARP